MIVEAEREVAKAADQIDRAEVRNMTGLHDSDIDSGAYNFPACIRTVSQDGLLQYWSRFEVERWRDDLETFVRRLK